MISTQFRVGPNTFWVCIDSVTEDGRVSGTFQSCYLQRPIPFTGLDDFLVQADMAMEHLEFPQSDFNRRCFTPDGRQLKRKRMPVDPDITQKRTQATPYHSLTEIVQTNGTLADFWVYVLYRRNGSWQGRASYLKGGKTKMELDFRSALELMTAMRECLCEQGASLSSQVYGES